MLSLRGVGISVDDHETLQSSKVFGKVIFDNLYLIRTCGILSDRKKYVGNGYIIL